MSTKITSRADRIRISGRQFALGALLVALTLSGGWIGICLQQSWVKGRALLQDKARRVAMNIDQATSRSPLFGAVVSLGLRLKSAHAYLQSPGNADNILALKRELRAIAEKWDAHYAVVLDQSGTIKVIGTNGGRPDVTGHDCSSDFYFNQSIKGQPVVQLRLGNITQTKGAYFCAPIYLTPSQSSKKPAGAIALKKGLDFVERLVSDSQCSVLLLSPNHCVFHSNIPSLLCPDEEHAHRDFSQEMITHEGVTYLTGASPTTVMDHDGAWRIVVMLPVMQLIPWGGILLGIALIVMACASVAQILYITQQRREHQTRLEDAVAERTNELAESRERYKSVIAAMREGVIVINADGTVRSCNRSAEEILGLAPSDCMNLAVLRERWDAVTLQGDPLGFDDFPAHETLRSGAPQRSVYAGLRRENGETRWISMTSQPIFLTDSALPSAVVVTLRDITARLQAEGALRASEERYRSLFEEMPVGLYRARRDGILIDVNSALLDLLGHDHDADLAALRIEDWFAVPGAYREFDDRLRSLGLVLPTEARWRCTDGTEIWVRVSARLGHDDRTGEDVVDGSVEDITERKQAEQAMLRTQQLAAVGTLASGIAHQFNNIHGGVIGLLELSLMHGKLSENDRRNVEQALEATTRASDITRNLLAFTRQTRVHKSPIRLDQVIQDTLQIMSREFESEGGTIVLNSDPTLVILADESQISQVLMNLAINAMHAMTGAERKVLTIGCGREAGRIFLRVADTGCGIPPEMQEQIFLPFFSLKGEHAERGSVLSQVKGTGLGLSVCDTIIKRHGGEILLKSQPGEGAEFTVWLPEELLCMDEPMRVQSSAGLGRSKSGAHRGRVLVLDDEPMLRQVMCDLISDAGFTAEGTDDGDEALNTLRQIEYDIVLLDLQMPKMDGLEFLRQLEALALPKSPSVLLVTGRLAGTVDEEIRSPLVVNILYKPLRNQEIIDRLAEAIRKRKQLLAE